jgi:glycine/serine hydroxymethyltransferase
VGHLISEVLKNREDKRKISELKEEIQNLAQSFQPYGN